MSLCRTGLVSFSSASMASCRSLTPAAAPSWQVASIYWPAGTGQVILRYSVDIMYASLSSNPHS